MKLLGVCLFVIILAIAPECPAQQLSKEAEIPKKLEPAAKKAFDGKALYFIWFEKPAASTKDFVVHYAVNPARKGDIKADEVGTRVRLVRTVANGMRVPFTGVTPDIGYAFADRQFKGKIAVTVDLVQVPALDVDRPTRLSNETTVTVTFD